MTQSERKRLNPTTPEQEEKVWKMLVDVMSKAENVDINNAVKTGDEKKVAKAIQKTFKGSGEMLSFLGELTNALGGRHPDVLDAFRASIVKALMSCFKYVGIVGADPSNPDDQLTSGWAFPSDEKQSYLHIAWMMSMLADCFITKSFPVKTQLEADEALYNFFVHLASACAKEAMDEYKTNIDYLGIMENGNFLKRGENGEYIVKGVDCTKELPGNGYLEQLAKERDDDSRPN